MLYEKLAVQKTKRGSPIFVFLDSKCLNDGKNWEHGFMKALQTAQVIVLLLSNQVLKGICTNATKQQDNVLIEYHNHALLIYRLMSVRYECAVILNKLFNVPVLPVFLPDIEVDNNFARFSTKVAFPETPHHRDASSQLIIDELRCSTRCFLSYTYILQSIPAQIRFVIS